jgi:LuxR family maltose regulon positive regulatory protein
MPGDRAMPGQQTLEYLEQANLFLVPLDSERRWYRYHHLFGDLLRQRLEYAALSTEGEGWELTELHKRASIWFEEDGQELEAFQHAAAAQDVDRAARLAEGGGMPLTFRGAVAPVLQWLASLPATTLDARPSLWVMYASALTMTGEPPDKVEAILQAAEAALARTPQDERTKDLLGTRDLLGQIAAIRAMLAVPQSEVETIIAQSRRALALLHPDNLPVRTSTTWTLGYAYQVQGERAAASQAYQQAIAHSQVAGNLMITLAATTCLGQVQETENQLKQAAASYRQVLELTGKPPWPTACEAYLGLARISYQWNDLDAAETFGQLSLKLARQLPNVDTPAACGVFLARLSLAQGDVAGASALLAETEQFVLEQNFVHWLDAVGAVQVELLLHQGKLADAAQLARARHLPLSQARVLLAQGDPEEALAMLGPVLREAAAKGWADRRLEALMLQAVAHQAQGENGKAEQTLAEALALAAPGGFVRLFVDEGPPMARLLREAAKRGRGPITYVQQLQAAFEESSGAPAVTQNLADPLTDRELDVLTLLKSDLSGPEIARELMVSLNTMRTHTKNIYSKLGVNSRRSAVSRAEELGLL